MSDSLLISNLVEKYKSIFQLGLAWKNAPNVGQWGVVSYQVMLQLIFAKDCMERLDGDILEIGSRYGAHTVPFLDLAAYYGRKVIAIDPYNGKQEGNGEVYEEFLKNIGERKNLIHYREQSQNQILQQKIIDENKFCYVFVDGLHDDDACTQDINFTEKVLQPLGLMCVDDTNYLKDNREMAGPGKSVRFILENQKDIWEPLLYPDNIPLDSNIFQPVDKENNNNEKSCHFFIKK